MNIEVILLGIASSIRPTSLAAVYALVSAREPRRLMLAYTVAGLVFTLGFGVLIVWAFHGISINQGTDETKGIAEIAAGIIAIVFATLVMTGRITGPQADDAPNVPSKWTAMFDRRLTMKTAAIAGPLTHIPGLFYLIALNVIVSSKPTIAGGLFAILLYNAAWFALPIAALVICFFRPESARELVEAIETWAKAHVREILIAVSYIAGGALLARGALTV